MTTKNKLSVSRKKKVKKVRVYAYFDKYEGWVASEIKWALGGRESKQMLATLHIET